MFFHAASELVWNSFAVFILEDASSIWMKLEKLLLFFWQCVSSIKTGTRRIARPLDKIPFVVRRNGNYSWRTVRTLEASFSITLYAQSFGTYNGIHALA